MFLFIVCYVPSEKSRGPALFDQNGCLSGNVSETALELGTFIPAPDPAPGVLKKLTVKALIREGDEGFLKADLSFLAKIEEEKKSMVAMFDSNPAINELMTMVTVYFATCSLIIIFFILIVFCTSLFVQQHAGSLCSHQNI
jgi:hypothetical protein